MTPERPPVPDGFELTVVDDYGLGWVRLSHSCGDVKAFANPTPDRVRWFVTSHRCGPGEWQEHTCAAWCDHTEDNTTDLAADTLTAPGNRTAGPTPRPPAPRHYLTHGSIGYQFGPLGGDPTLWELIVEDDDAEVVLIATLPAFLGMGLTIAGMAASYRERA